MTTTFSRGVRQVINLRVIVLLGVPAILGFSALGASAKVVPTQASFAICHGTASDDNPYVVNSPDPSGDLNGHADHVGPIWNSTLKDSHTSWGDIIAPFDWTLDGIPQHYAGLNWDAQGQAVFANGCAIPTVVPTQEATVEPTATATATASATAEPTATATAEPTATATAEPTATATAEASATATAEASATATAEPTATATPTPTLKPTPTPSPTEFTGGGGGLTEGGGPVTVPVTSGSGSLAYTGAPLLAWVDLALGLLVAGLVLNLLGRRRSV